MVRNSKFASRTMLSLASEIMCTLAGILAGLVPGRPPATARNRGYPADPTPRRLAWSSRAAVRSAWLTSASSPGSKSTTSRSATSPEPAWAGSWAASTPPAVLPAEVRELVSNRSSGTTYLRGQVPSRTSPSAAKQDSHVIYPGSIEFGIKKGVQFPSGFDSGQEVQFILDRVALPYSTIQNFDQLPIPYGCVATDLDSGKKYVFQQRLLRNRHALDNVAARLLFSGARRRSPIR